MLILTNFIGNVEIIGKTMDHKVRQKDKHDIMYGVVTGIDS